MNNLFSSRIVIEAALRKHYAAAVTKRVGKFISNRINNRQLLEVATWLDDARLAKLFIEAQFKCFPVSWCLDKINRKYPLPNMVFGTMSISRYVSYVAEGVREPV